MSWTIREGRLDEIERLVALRSAMFEAMGTDPTVIERVADASRRYFEEEMTSGAFRIWIAVDERDEPIASIGLVVHSAPPRPTNLVGKTGYIMNLVTLHASEDGQRLYEELGFWVADTLPEMRLPL